MLINFFGFISKFNANLSLSEDRGRYERSAESHIHNFGGVPNAVESSLQMLPGPSCLITTTKRRGNCVRISIESALTLTRYPGAFNLHELVRSRLYIPSSRRQVWAGDGTAGT
jgi:hypothetical protein